MSAMNSAPPKIPVSVVVIGFQPEAPLLYPHLKDFLSLLRDTCEEVVYLDSDDRGEGLYCFDSMIQVIRNLLPNRKGREQQGLSEYQRVCDTNRFKDKLKRCISSAYGIPSRGISGLARHLKKRYLLGRRVRTLSLSGQRKLLIAIDHTAVSIALENFTGQVVFWSYDIICEDAPWRIKNGFLERLMLNDASLVSKLPIMIQDEGRKFLLESAICEHVIDPIYFPVGLLDSVICQKAANKRADGLTGKQCSVLQNGYIAEIRWSSELMKSYQTWPEQYLLAFHGLIRPEYQAEVFSSVLRYPQIDTKMIDGDELAEYLDCYDVGFVGYREQDLNHIHIEHASLQSVLFLRLGIPIICCASNRFGSFISSRQCGISISHPSETLSALEVITNNYPEFSKASRTTFEECFNLGVLYSERVLPFIKKIATM